jgi:hypothetical protein
MGNIPIAESTSDIDIINGELNRQAQNMKESMGKKKEKVAITEIKEEAPYLCQKDMLAILGAADPSRRAAPYEDSNFEIWCPSIMLTFPDFKRADCFFELHTEGYFDREDIIKRLQKIKQPLYMQQVYEEFPTSIRYPIEIIKQYRQYHTNSISYMLALAFHSFVTTGKPRHLALFGIVMSCEEEYGEQRPCCEYWLGRLEGAGVDIEISPDSAILASPGLYGYQTYNPILLDLRQRIDGLQVGMKQTNQELTTWTQQKYRQEGAIEESRFWLDKLTKGAFY